MNIEFFCAREIEKQSERMTTTTEWIFFNVVIKIHEVVVVILEDFFLFRGHRKTLYEAQKKVISYFERLLTENIVEHFGRR